MKEVGREIVTELIRPTLLLPHLRQTPISRTQSKPFLLVFDAVNWLLWLVIWEARDSRAI
jgi:hypothetical protein